MEESLNNSIKAKFNIPDVDIRTYSPLTLAYIGDAIFDIVIRSIVVDAGNTSPNKLHHMTSQIVKAQSQAMMAEALKDYMVDEEADIYRRGRNAKSNSVAKNASVADYRSATGFEALMGYLYLTDQVDRMLELIDIGLERCQLRPGCNK